jgi:hypothetical protein
MESCGALLRRGAAGCGCGPPRERKVRRPCRAVPCRRVNFFHERYFVLLEPRLLPDGSSAQAILYYQSAKQRGGKPAGEFRLGLHSGAEEERGCGCGHAGARLRSRHTCRCDSHQRHHRNQGASGDKEGQPGA